MKILMSGASGLIGTSVREYLHANGHETVRLVRGPAESHEKTVFWDPYEHRIDAAEIEGIDAVVHLSGESLAGLRWTQSKKKRIHDSRVISTRFLSEVVSTLSDPPKVFVSASGAGYYGDRGHEVVTEQSGPGRGFVAELCADWEAAAQPVKDAGVRIVHMRTGVVLTKKGGALPLMLPVFKLGLGGKLGTGNQYFSWIALEDVVHIIEFLLYAESLSGPVNLVAPEPVTNAEYTICLGKVLRRPTFLTVPRLAVRAMFGEMGDELLLRGQRALPQKLTDAGFEFRHRCLEDALIHILKTPDS